MMSIKDDITIEITSYHVYNVVSYHKLVNNVFLWIIKEKIHFI